jgi:hypothetical protein
MSLILFTSFITNIIMVILGFMIGYYYYINYYYINIHGPNSTSVKNTVFVDGINNDKYYKYTPYVVISI